MHLQSQNNFPNTILDFKFEQNPVVWTIPYEANYTTLHNFESHLYRVSPGAIRLQPDMFTNIHISHENAVHVVEDTLKICLITDEFTDIIKPTLRPYLRFDIWFNTQNLASTYSPIVLMDVWFDENHVKKPLTVQDKNRILTKIVNQSKNIEAVCPVFSISMLTGSDAFEALATIEILPEDQNCNYGLYSDNAYNGRAISYVQADISKIIT